MLGNPEQNLKSKLTAYFTIQCKDSLPFKCVWGGVGPQLSKKSLQYLGLFL